MWFRRTWMAIKCVHYAIAFNKRQRWVHADVFYRCISNRYIFRCELIILYPFIGRNEQSIYSHWLNSNKMMQIFGIGIDIAYVPRFIKIFERYGERFLKRAYHKNEIKEFHHKSTRSKAHFLASRWPIWTLSRALYISSTGGQSKKQSIKHFSTIEYRFRKSVSSLQPMEYRNVLPSWNSMDIWNH